jgi:outer membrane protein W
MPFPISLLLTTALLAPPGADAPAPADPAPQQRQQEDPSKANPTDRPHQFGLGAFGGSGGGASFRYFAKDRVGVDLDIGYAGASTGGGRSGGSTFRVAPSAVYMFTKANSLANIDWRPYAGVGFNYAYTSQVYSQTSSSQLRNSGLGMQAFGGVELTFAAARNISISAQVAYYKLAVQPLNLLSTSGTDVYLLFHYYVK